MKKLLLIILIFLCLGLFACKDSKDETGKTAFQLEYEFYYNEDNIKDSWKTWYDVDFFRQAVEKRRFIKISIDDAIKKIDSGEEFVLYFGFDPTLYKCPNCVCSIPYAVSVLEELDMYCYYVEIYTARQNNTEEYQKFYNAIVNAFDDYVTLSGDEVLRASTVVRYKDKTPQKFHLATLKDSENNNIHNLTEEQKEELKNIYRDLFSGK